MGKIARISLRYDTASARIIGIDLIAAPAPVSLFSPTPTSTGAWLTVIDSDGNEIFHKPLPDPFVGGEVLDESGAMKRLKERRTPHFASVEAPWPGPRSRIVVHAREVAPRWDRAVSATPTSEIATLPFEPRQEPTADPSLVGLVGKSAKAFPVTIDSRWGHDNPKALHLVFMPEGFLASEMTLFHKQVDIVAKLFEQTRPYSNLLRALKIARIEIPSEVNNIGNSAGRTFFKARFTSEGITRVIEIDQTIASETISNYFRSQSARGLVVANTTTYGGSGGAAAVFSCEPRWSPHIAIHELGHSHFGLADEYSEAGQAATKDPVEPNVCADFTRARLKWANLVSADTPLPTWSAGDPDPSDARIGAYEGGKYQVNGIWRPAFNCKMRHVETPEFCAVCQDIITRTLQVYLG